MYPVFIMPPSMEVIDILIHQNYLCLEDIYALLSTSSAFRKKLTPPVIQSALRVKPLRGKHRYNWWVMHLLHASSSSPKLQNLYTGDCLYHYLSIIQQLGVARASPNTPGQIGEVMRDVKRTFPMQPFFADGMPGQDMLARILQACIISQPEVGYCQGMNFVVGAFIASHPICSECPEHVMQEHMMQGLPVAPPGGGKLPPAKFWAPAMHFNYINLAEAESEIYVVLMCLLDSEGMFNMQCAWRAGMPVMRLYNYQFDRLLKWNFARLHSHFIEIGFSPEILLSQWLLTFFIYTFPLDRCMDMWDYVMSFGWPGIFSLALGFCGVMQDRLVQMDLEDLSMEMRTWKCDKFEFPDGVTFEDFIALSNSICVTDSELLTLQEAFASKLVSDAAATTHTAEQQPHLGVKDLAQLTKSIGRYLKKSNVPTNFSENNRLAGVGLLSPFSHSGFLETPIEDFNSVANFNERVQKDLASIFMELVDLNKQVESDKEVYVLKIVNTSQRLDNLKNELEVITSKEQMTAEAVEVIRTELALAVEAEQEGGIGGSIHNSEALGLGSNHGRNRHSSSTPPSDRVIRQGMMLTEPYTELKIQSQGSSDSSPMRTTPRKSASATEPGLLDIVAYRKTRTPRHSPTSARSPGKPMNGQRVSSDLGQARTHSHSNHAHINGVNSKSPEKPPLSPLATSPPAASAKDTLPRTRRYIRGKHQTSPVKPLVKQSSLEEIDLSDPGDKPRSSPVERYETDKAALDKSVSSASSMSNRFSLFSRKTSPPVPPVGGGNLLQAVKTGRRASSIMEADSTHSQTGTLDSSTTGTDIDVSSGHGRDITVSGEVAQGGRSERKDSGTDEAILQMMSMSTTQFIPDPTLHPDAGALGNVLEMAASWVGSNKKGSVFLRSQLEVTEVAFKKLAMQKLETTTDIEEEIEKKDRLCEQLQLLIEEMYKTRTAILRKVIRKYVMADKVA